MSTTEPILVPRRLPHRQAARAALGLLLAVLLVVAGVIGVSRLTAAPSTVPGTATTSTSPEVAVPVVQVGTPQRVKIPAIDVDAELVPVGLLPDGAMQTPDFGLGAWYDLGPLPGEPGPAVVLAHVDSKAGPDVFYRLKELRSGDEVTVEHEHGSVTFVVESSEQVAKEELPAERIWNDSDKPVLRLITCGGSFDRASGNYRDNVIVYASLVADRQG